MSCENVRSRTDPTSDGSELYGQQYYESYCGGPYRKGEQHWEEFFGRVADEICRSLNPRRVFDAGCAIGFLVESLWDRGIEAYGRDISQYAIDQVRRDIQPYCEVASLEDPVPGRYDLVCCIEVLEHLTPQAADLAIENLTRVSDRILFSSSPDELEEETHINVRPPIYWIRRFAQHGFSPVAWYDATFLAPHAILFERAEDPIDEAYIVMASQLVQTRVRLAHEVGTRVELNIRLSEALQDSWNAGQSVQEAERRIAELQGALESGERSLRRAQAEIEDQSRRFAEERSRLTGQAEYRDAEIEALVREAEQLRASVAHHVDEAHRQHARADAAEAYVTAMRSSVFWRVTEPARQVSGALPAPVRRLVRRFAGAVRRGSSSRTPRVQLGGGASGADGAGEEVRQAPPAGGGTAETGVEGTHEQASFGKDHRFPHLGPIRVYRAADPTRIVNVVTDSVSAGSLFGGVGTALILGALSASRLGAQLRVVTRTEAGDVGAIARVLRANGLDGIDVETDHLPPTGNGELPIGPSDIFIPTAWWTGMPTVGALGHRRVVYLLQEDERIFYPLGDEHLLCTEFLSDQRLRCVINSELLFRHLSEGPDPLPGLADRSVWFEPAFQSNLFFDDAEGRRAQQKQVFLMYARPNNVRNLFWRGVEVLQEALGSRLMDPAAWKIVLVGKDIPHIDLPGNPEMQVAENLAWDDYAALVRSARVGMSLIYSPHPSYPPLDLAASGAVVLTNTYGESKVDLSKYSGNIVCAPPTVGGLLDGLSRALELADDEEKRLANVTNAGLNRDWKAALAGVVDQILDWTTQ